MRLLHSIRQNGQGGRGLSWNRIAPKEEQFSGTLDCPGRTADIWSTCF